MNEQTLQTAESNDSAQQPMAPVAMMAQQFLDARPRLRDDLVFRPQRVAKRVIYLIEDPIASKFYRLGQVEYLLAASFDGQRTVRESLALANRQTAERSSVYQPDKVARAACPPVGPQDQHHVTHPARCPLTDPVKKYSTPTPTGGEAASATPTWALEINRTDSESQSTSGENRLPGEPDPEGSHGGQHAVAVTAPLSEADALTVYQWAAQNELLDREIPPRTDGPAASLLQSAQRTLAAWNLITFRLPGFCPERLLARIHPYLNWLYSSWANGFALVLIAYACMRLLPRWDQFVLSTAGIFSPVGQLSLLVCWILLKVAHELSHGLVCRRYGGNVREAGVLLILFVPLAYVDVTSSWRFRSKWQRIHTAAAGMQLELYLAALAAILWSFTSPGVCNQACANVVLMSSITTILFNANPLMRFDGYYILTDFLEVPNLYATGQAWLRSLGGRLFLGLQSPRMSGAKGLQVWIRIYAVLTFFWRLLIYSGLIVAAASLWHGAGILLAALAISLWIGLPLAKLARFLCWGSPGVRPRRVHFLLASSTAALGATMLLVLVPWPGAIRAPAIIQYDPLTVVRSRSPGFVRQVRVSSGEHVVAGQILAILRNSDLECQTAQLQLKIEGQRARARGLLGRHELAAHKALLEECEALELHLAELRKQVDGLCIRAPAAGQVISRGVDRLVGHFIQQGDEVISLGDETRKQVRFSVAQDHLTDFQDCLGKPVVVSVASLDSLTCRLEGIGPRASLHPLDAALCSSYGGALVIRNTAGNVQHPNSPLDSMELLEPHFTGTIRLSIEQSLQVRAGQRASVGLCEHRRSLGETFYFIFDQWIMCRTANVSI